VLFSPFTEELSAKMKPSSTIWDWAMGRNLSSIVASRYLPEASSYTKE
jgi:hypothetical protein